jgi:UDP-N-acetylglucosamine diphosphorylase/glucosamine-1-phosphate N-acetyltransferase
MTLYLVEDSRARRWSPFAESRPVGELRFGAGLLRERIERHFARPCAGYLGAPELDGFDEPGAPPEAAPELAPPGGAVLWLSRAAPYWRKDGASTPPVTPGQAWVMGDRVVGVAVAEGESLPGAATRLGAGPAGGTRLSEVPGWLLGWPWDLVDGNAEALTHDLLGLHGDGDLPAGSTPPGVLRVGDGVLSVAEGARLGAGVIVDTRDGPVRLEAHVTVEGPARLVGPLHLGAGSTVFGGHLSRLSAGPVCKLRGEIDTVVLTGFVNKAHDGYLGHALAGRWVNLGALTTNSDLKNNYGPVRIELPDGTQDTGLMKVGVFLGDHVKTGIGTVLNTGTLVGVGSNVFGGGMPPKSLPPFSWAGGGRVVPFHWDRFLEVARVVTARRDQPWTPGAEAILRRLWERTHGPAE